MTADPASRLWKLAVFWMLLAGCAGEARTAPMGGWVTGVEPGTESAPNVASSGVVPVPLANCGKTEEGFEGWMLSFRQHAEGQGISAKTLALSVDALSYDGAVIAADRDWSSFKLTPEAFVAKHVTAGRVARAKGLVRADTELLGRVEARFGVAPEVLVAIWGLETDFGDNPGKYATMRCLATLAYDCHRPTRFRAELLAALRLVERGDLAPEAMVGAWAGELGQTQFLPSSYEQFAVDFDGDGRADIINSSADALASTANYLSAHGWRAGEPYTDGTPNFTALGTWNASNIYRGAIIAFAAKIKPHKPNR